MKILLSFAHPDDETFSVAGTVIKMFKAGYKISLITATYGQMGLSADIKVDSPEHLGRIRKGEMEEAAKITGISKIHYFGLMDGELYKQKITALADKILPVMLEEKPDIVITFEKKGGSNHPDHIRMSYATTHAFKEYLKSAKKLIRLYHTVTPRSYYVQYEKAGLETNTGFGHAKGVYDSHITTTIDISDVFELKLKALACHKTQSKDVARYKSRHEHVDLKKEFLKLMIENGIA
jgi:LmbE family N-acetylglucosaminyl deacetylase